MKNKDLEDVTESKPAILLNSIARMIFQRAAPSFDSENYHLLRFLAIFLSFCNSY